MVGLAGETVDGLVLDLADLSGWAAGTRSAVSVSAMTSASPGILAKPGVMACRAGGIHSVGEPVATLSGRSGIVSGPTAGWRTTIRFHCRL